ncbi:hypothetical protein CS078_10330 [Pseudomonas prosekii]|uniref:Uncharacterized protein n=1 Tax=Pseudomonas prosekii TaxID=1148509 RepID=A0A3L8CQI7_9PSED|nr:hypothetical protein [Pseudomonas prosekii]RLU07406.1 hypothetical protein CS076_18315 [Pseudomonas prosekii]RLU10505.1 hypothetical protein CS078_10330 [Pseudomonas prosekii]
MIEFNQVLQDYRVGDYAGLLGLLISLIGFFFTIKTTLASRAASEQAAAAVESVRSDLRKGETVADFATALAVMDEIKRMHRADSLVFLPDRYSSLKKFLVSIKASNPMLAEADQSAIQSAIAKFSAMENFIEKSIRMAVPVEHDKMNGQVSKHYDVIQALLVKIKNEIGSGGFR